MCNDRSNNLDHFDHVHFWAEKMKRFGSLKDKACSLCDKHFTIPARYIWCGENSITICYKYYVCINKEKELHAEMNVNICHLQFATRYFVCCFDHFDHFQRQSFICVFEQIRPYNRTVNTLHWCILYLI